MFLKDKYQNHTIEVQTELNILETQKIKHFILKYTTNKNIVFKYKIQFNHHHQGHSDASESGRIRVIQDMGQKSVQFYM